MGIFGNLSEKVEKQARQELSGILPEGEEIENIYIVKEDFCAFTPKRVVFVDKKLISSRKTVTSIMYNKINFVALKRGGTFSISKEVVIGTSGANLEIDTWDSKQAYEIMLKFLHA